MLYSRRQTPFYRILNDDSLSTKSDNIIFLNSVFGIWIWMKFFDFRYMIYATSHCCFYLGPGICPRLVSARAFRAWADTNDLGWYQGLDQNNSGIFYMYDIVNIIKKDKKTTARFVPLDLKSSCTIIFELLLVNVNFFSVKAFLTNLWSTRYLIKRYALKNFER